MGWMIYPELDIRVAVVIAWKLQLELLKPSENIRFKETS
jgi:hypothetical protein